MTTGLDSAFAFSGLVTGAANHLAVSAARAVAESAQPPFNPLILYGGEGLGKSHLLHAIGHLRLEVEPRAVVRAASWNELADARRTAHATGRVHEVLGPYLECGLLLLDDVHRVLERVDGRAEILALLQARIAAGRTTVLASRRPPSELAAIDDDAAARLFAGGLSVELLPPDAAMRWEIIYRRSASGGVEMSPAVLEEIASLSFASIRDLVGAANRLLAFQAVSSASLDPAQARVLITGVLDEPRPDAGVPTNGAEPARPAPEPRSETDTADEFGSFLSEVVASVSQQVDRWRGRLADAMLRWQGEGYHTARLQALLDQELATQPEQLLHGFENDIEQLRRLEAEARELAPDIALHEAFKDPDQLGLAQQLVDEARVRGLAVHQPQSQYRLDALVAGPSNRLALDAVRAVVAEPAGGPNPLLVVGESGVGKTHLLHALGNALADAGLRGVVCLGAHALEASIQEASEAGQLPHWRRRFRYAAAFLLDDLHLLAGRPAVQEELAGLLDQLSGSGRQVVLTSSVSVAELSGLAPAVLARLGAGIVVEIPRPDRDVRLGVVRRLLAGTPAEDDAALAEYLASRPADAVRAVQTLVQRVLRAAESVELPLGIGLARQVLESASRGGPRPAHRPGVLGPTVGGPRLREKLVVVWPNPADRLIEDFR